jgi:SAM-dependent methyltransferase
MPTNEMVADFDRIAEVSYEGWSHNSHYHNVLLRQLPSRLGSALEVGCGTGAFTRLLAERADRVLGLDLSPGMVQVARARSGAYPNITYQVADFTQWEFPPQGFDCVASIATLHHLPLAETLGRMGQALRPGGTLLVVDLYKQQGVWEYLTSGPAILASLALKLVKTGRLRDPEPVRQAWAAHGPHDVYPTLAKVRRARDGILPGAVVRRHLLWRYSLVWRKPGGPELTEPLDRGPASAGNRR